MIRFRYGPGPLTAWIGLLVMGGLVMLCLRAYRARAANQAWTGGCRSCSTAGGFSPTSRRNEQVSKRRWHVWQRAEDLIYQVVPELTGMDWGEEISHEAPPQSSTTDCRRPHVESTDDFHLLRGDGAGKSTIARLIDYCFWWRLDMTPALQSEASCRPRRPRQHQRRASSDFSAPPTPTKPASWGNPSGRTAARCAGPRCDSGSATQHRRRGPFRSSILLGGREASAESAPQPSEGRVGTPAPEL